MSTNRHITLFHAPNSRSAGARASRRGTLCRAHAAGTRPEGHAATRTAPTWAQPDGQGVRAAPRRQHRHRAGRDLPVPRRTLRGAGSSPAPGIRCAAPTCAGWCSTAPVSNRPWSIARCSAKRARPACRPTAAMRPWSARSNSNCSCVLAARRTLHCGGRVVGSALGRICFQADAALAGGWRLPGALPGAAGRAAGASAGCGAGRESLSRAAPYQPWDAPATPATPGSMRARPAACEAELHRRTRIEDLHRLLGKPREQGIGLRRGGDQRDLLRPVGQFDEVPAVQPVMVPDAPRPPPGASRPCSLRSRITSISQWESLLAAVPPAFDRVQGDLIAFHDMPPCRRAARRRRVPGAAPVPV